MGAYLVVHALGLQFTLETELLVVAAGGLVLGIFFMTLDVVIFTLYEGRAYLLGRFVWRNSLKYPLINRLNREINEKYVEDKKILSMKNRLNQRISEKRKQDERILSRLSELRKKEELTAKDEEETRKLEKETKNVEKEIQKLEQEIKKLEDRRGETWEFLLSFPVQEAYGESRRAVAPTRLGNILLEAELYPEATYSMDVAFYWYRLRHVLPDVVFNTMDKAKAIADFLVYLSFFLIFYTPLHLIGYLIQGQTLIALLGGVAGLPVAYLLYRISLSPLSIYGQHFKAAFDNYRSDLAEEMGLGPETLSFESQQKIEGEKERWRRAWLFLQYQWPLPSIKSYKIEEIVDDDALVKKLKKLGINTTEDLLKSDIADVASVTGIKKSLLKKWKEIAHLISVEGVKPAYGELLHSIGMNSIESLALAKPKDLQMAITKLAKQGKWPSVSKLKKLIANAKKQSINR